MTKKTNNYDMFKFRSDNRAVIDETHINKLVESIKMRNLLELRPIIVNSDFEIIDGQHRLLAAKKLGIEVYYDVKPDLQAGDIILMNVSKSWGIQDYLNYFCKNGFPEYQKLTKFVKERGIALKVAVALTMGMSKQSYVMFRNGSYKFPEDNYEEGLNKCLEIVAFIKKNKGYSPYCESAKFWMPLLCLVMREEFDLKKWFHNLGMFIEKLGPRANQKDYKRLFMDIYNYRNQNKINLLD